MDRLKGKIAIVTGAGTGVGRACMKLFAAEGAKVVGVSRTQANLDETLAQVKAAGGEGKVVAADLAKPEGAEKTVAETLNTYGRDRHARELGRRRVQLAGKESRARWGRSTTRRRKNGGGDGDQPQLAVSHVPSRDPANEETGRRLDRQRDQHFRIFRVCRWLTPTRLRKGRRSTSPVRSRITYCGDNIRVNCIAPGFIDTPMVASVLGPV